MIISNLNTNSSRRGIGGDICAHLTIFIRLLTLPLVFLGGGFCGVLFSTPVVQAKGGLHAPELKYRHHPHREILLSDFAR